MIGTLLLIFFLGIFFYAGFLYGKAITKWELKISEKPITRKCKDPITW